MPDRSLGDSAQIRMITDQAAEAGATVAISKFAAQHPELRRGTVVSEIPAPLKWAAIIASAVLTVSASAGLIWMVTSVSAMSVTLARMDERLGGYIDAQAARMTQLENRVDQLESYHRNGGR